MVVLIDWNNYRLGVEKEGMHADPQDLVRAAKIAGYRVVHVALFNDSHRLPDRARNAFASNGVAIIDCPRRKGGAEVKDTVDPVMMCHMAFIAGYVDVDAVLLVTNDRDFLPMAGTLKHSGLAVVAARRRGGRNGAVAANADRIIDYSPSAPRSPSGSTNIAVAELPFHRGRIIAALSEGRAGFDGADEEDVKAMADILSVVRFMRDGDQRTEKRDYGQLKLWIRNVALGRTRSNDIVKAYLSVLQAAGILAERQCTSRGGDFNWTYLVLDRRRKILKAVDPAPFTPPVRIGAPSVKAGEATDVPPGGTEGAPSVEESENDANAVPVSRNFAAPWV